MKYVNVGHSQVIQVSLHLLFYVISWLEVVKLNTMKALRSFTLLGMTHRFSKFYVPSYNIRY